MGDEVDRSTGYMKTNRGKLALFEPMDARLAAIEARLAALEHVEAARRGDVPYVAASAPIHHREDLADVVDRLAQAAPGAPRDVRFTTTEHTTSPETQAAVDRFNAQPEPWKREVLRKLAEGKLPTRAEKAFAQKANDLRSELDAVLDANRESPRPARRRRWWRLWT